MALLYSLLLMTTVIGLCSLGVEWGRVQLVKTELQRAADAAARYGALGLANDAATGRANALLAASDNTADSTAVTLSATDVEFGSWNSATHTFTVVAGSAEASASAVRVTARRTAATGNAVPLLFARILGRSSCDVTAVSVATLTRGTQSSMAVSSNSNPYLAGSPAGTVANPVNPHNNPDYAGTSADPRQSPPQFSAFPLQAGQGLTFDAINGGANNFSSNILYTADGNTGWITGNLAGDENGKSNVIAPINAVVGVFLDDTTPRSGDTVPAALDFSSQAARDFTSLAPKLRQVFFIGDGRTSGGVVQQFTVPQGATRLFLATMDQYEWNNNVGTYAVTVHRVPKVSLVK